MRPKDLASSMPVGAGKRKSGGHEVNDTPSAKRQRPMPRASNRADRTEMEQGGEKPWSPRRSKGRWTRPLAQGNRQEGQSTIPKVANWGETARMIENVRTKSSRKHEDSMHFVSHNTSHGPKGSGPFFNCVLTAY
jgi:hypothetical protein